MAELAIGMPQAELDDDLNFPDLGRKATATVAASTAGSVVLKCAGNGIANAAQKHFASRAAQEVATTGAKVAGTELGEAVGSTFVPGLGFVVGFGVNSVKLYQQITRLQQYGEKTDGDALYMIFDPEARGEALRAVGDFCVNIATDATSFVPVLGGWVGFALSLTIKGAQTARDIADPTLVTLTDEFQTAIDNGEKMPMSRMAVMVQKSLEATDPAFAEEFKRAVEAKDPAAALTMQEMWEAMQANKNVAGTIKYAAHSGEMKQHFKEEQVKIGQMLGMQTPQLAVTPQSGKPVLSESIEKLKQRLTGGADRLLKSDAKETQERLAAHGVKHSEKQEAKTNRSPVDSGQAVKSLNNRLEAAPKAFPVSKPYHEKPVAKQNTGKPMPATYQGVTLNAEALQGLKGVTADSLGNNAHGYTPDMVTNMKAKSASKGI